jgi:TM2 domain-containing membrane protein YozV
MKWEITGANRESGRDEKLLIEADDEASARRRANRKGVLVGSARAIDPDDSVYGKRAPAGAGARKPALTDAEVERALKRSTELAARPEPVRVSTVQVPPAYVPPMPPPTPNAAPYPHPAAYAAPAPQVVYMMPPQAPPVYIQNTQIMHAQALVRRWSPGVAALLSFLIPGLGQMYKGQVINGLVWFIVVAVGYAFLIIPGLVLHVCCVLGAAMGDPYR